jgi:hypothetical protein
MSVRAAMPTLVARAEELAALLAAVELAAEGEAATVIVSGEAGVGKSRLAEELMRTARADGSWCCSAAAWTSRTSRTRRSPARWAR